MLLFLCPFPCFLFPRASSCHIVSRFNPCLIHSSCLCCVFLLNVLCVPFSSLIVLDHYQLCLVSVCMRVWVCVQCVSSLGFVVSVCSFPSSLPLDFGLFVSLVFSFTYFFPMFLCFVICFFVFFWISFSFEPDVCLDTLSPQPENVLPFEFTKCHGVFFISA